MAFPKDERVGIMKAARSTRRYVVISHPPSLDVTCAILTAESSMRLDEVVAAFVHGLEEDGVRMLDETREHLKKRCLAEPDMASCEVPYQIHGQLEIYMMLIHEVDPETDEWIITG